MSEPETYDEIRNELYGNRKAVLEALQFYNGKANSKQIRIEGEIPQGSKHDVLSRLEEWGVIEKTGSEPAGKGGHADVYRLTNRGQMLREDIVDRTTTVDDVEELTESVERLNSKVKEHDETMRQLEEQMKRFEELADTLEDYLRERR